MSATISHTPFETPASLGAAVQGLLQETLGQASEPSFAVVLSGGNTPLPIFQAIAADPFPVNPKAWVTYTDDRHVPADSPDSNYGNSKPMLDALGIGDERIIRVQPDLPLEAAADAFENDLTRFLDAGGRVALALLGLGTDGHTCSLFGEEDLARCEGRLAAPVYKDTPPNRVTVSPAFLNRVERVVFMVAGPEKEEMCRALREAPDTITAGRAVAGCPRVELWQA